MTISVLPNHVWEFNSTGNDLVGSMHHTLAGTTTASGKPTYALENDGSVAFRNVAYNLGAGAWSVSQWVKTAPTTADVSCFSLGDIRISLSPSGDTARVYRESNSATMDVSGSTVINANTWYLIIATRSSGGTIKIYNNGTLVTTGSASTFNDGTGGSQFGELNGEAALTGQTAAWESEITADDVTYIYNAGSGLAYASWEETPTEPGPDVRVDAILSDMVIRL